MIIDNSNNAFDLFDDDDIDFDNEIIKEFDEAVAKNSVITTSAEQTKNKNRRTTTKITCIQK